MNQQAYKLAHELQQEISKLKYELEILKQSYEKPTSIRFGTEYNVSIPIVFDESLYKGLVSSQIGFHISKIQSLEKEFKNL